MKADLPILLFTDQPAWESWLQLNHAKSNGVWLKVAKKNSGVTSVNYEQALESALCYGWIDSQISGFDREFYLIKFSPRRPKSKWSRMNCEKAERLIAAGRMQPAGLMQVELAKADGRWESAYDPPSRISTPSDLQAELDCTYQATRNEVGFQQRLGDLLAHYVGRHTPLYHAQHLSSTLGGAQIYLKREDLAHTGAHKINNALGQALHAKHMGKRHIVAETGAGQHGVACATVASLLGLECVVNMGRLDMQRQGTNVQRMQLLGARVCLVDSGSQTLKDAVNEAIRDWVSNVRDTYYLQGSALGPHPYPTIMRDFQAIIGNEARTQILRQEERLPEACIACVGGGSNTIGLFYAFLADKEVRLIGVEAGGKGIESGKHAARFAVVSPSNNGKQDKCIQGRPGVLQGTYTYVLQDADGQIAPTHSISAGLDYAAVGPEHAYLRQQGRAEYTWATDDQALDAFQQLSHLEGILPAPESAHGIAEAIRIAPLLSTDQILLVNLSGRGDKDLEIVNGVLGESIEP